MHFDKFILVACLMTGLTACGGGSSGPPGPIFAGDAPPVGIEDFLGLDFPLKVAVVDVENGVVNGAVQDVYTLRFNSPSQAVLTSPLGPITLNEVLGDFEGTSGDRNTSLTAPDGGEYLALLFVEDGIVSTETGYFGGAIFGLETTLAGISTLVDGNAFASYEGGGLVVIATGPDIGDIVTVEGTTQLGVAFGSGAVIGSLIDDGTSVFSLIGGQVSGHGFTGTVQISGDLDTQLSISSSSVSGDFYGGAAEEIGGTFGGSGTWALGPATFAGVFAGADVP